MFRRRKDYINILIVNHLTELMAVKVEELKELLSKLKDKGIRYFVFGGMAVEALRGKITREHGDIDLLIFENQKEDYKKALSELNFTGAFSEKGGLYRATRNNLQVDALFMQKREKDFFINGDKEEVSLPLELFDIPCVGEIEGFELSLEPLDFLFWALPFYDKEEDRETILSYKTRVDMALVKAIVGKSKRDPNSPKAILHKQRKEMYGFHS